MIPLDNCQRLETYTLERLVSLNLLTPELQRTIDDEVVQDIVEYQTQRFQKYRSFLFTGVIVAAQIGARMFLVDGQHRLRAMQRLYLSQPDYKIAVLIVSVNEQFSMQELFVMLNKSKPVPDYIIETTTNLQQRAILDEFVLLFKRDFKAFLSKSKHPHRPNINLDLLADAIHASSLLPMMSSGQDLYNYIRFLNVNKWSLADPVNNFRCVEKVQDVLNAQVLYLGNVKDWKWGLQSKWVQEYRNQKLIPTVSAPSVTVSKEMPEHPRKRSRKSIPKQLRHQVWQRQFGDSLKGTCPLCSEALEYTQFECGHIMSAANQGTDTATNLLAICGSCNKSMGAMNMHDYSHTYLGKNLHELRGCAPLMDA
jgi:hypothetical protein